MNNYYALSYVTSEIKSILESARFRRAVTFQKNRLDLFLEKPPGGQASADPSAGQQTGEAAGKANDSAGVGEAHESGKAEPQPIKFTVSCDPSGMGCFVDRYHPPKKSNVRDFFRELDGAAVSRVHMSGEDRLVYLDFDSGDRLLLKLFGAGGGNVLLIREGGVIRSFRDEQQWIGAAEPQPSPPEPREPDPEKDARSRMLALNPRLPREGLGELIEQQQLESCSNEELRQVAGELADSLEREAVATNLNDGSVCLYPDHWVPLNRLERHESFNECIRFAYLFSRHLKKFQQRRSELLKRLGQAQKKLQARMREGENADKSLQRAGEYEKYAHLLMANLHRDHDGGEQLEVEDLYSGGERIRIPLKSGLSLSENAQRYYEKSRQARTSHTYAVTLYENSKKRYSRVTQLLDELKGIETLQDLEEWVKANAGILAEYDIDNKGKTGTHPRFRTMMVMNHDLWIGKNARNNDELLRSAHKEDIWLHARGVSGSHVIVRMQGSKEQPDSRLLEKAASVAAYYSKASGSELVPVSWTRCKYVRKPKGGAPGEAKVMRESTLMVEPGLPGDV